MRTSQRLLPLEKGIDEAVKIYLNRLKIFSFIVWLNLSIGFLVLFPSHLIATFFAIAPLTLFFPISYVVYSVSHQPTRLSRLKRDFELLTGEWDEALYRQSISVFNYTLSIVLAVSITLLGLFIFFMPLLDLASLDSIGLTALVLRAMRIGFLGTLLFSLYYVYRRYTTFDLSPHVYLYCAIMMTSGLVLNYVFFSLLDSVMVNPQEGLIPGVLDMVSFLIGFFSILSVQGLTRTAYEAFGQQQRRSDLFRLAQIDGISELHEVRLRDIGIDNIQNLAAVNIPMLLLSTPFPIQVIVDWVDQAILIVMLSDEYMLESLRKEHIRTWSDFFDRWAPYVEKYKLLQQNRDAAADEKKAAEIDTKLNTLIEEQTKFANALNSTVTMLDELYKSADRHPNKHVISNYRKNVELQLSSTEIYYNHHLLEAYHVKPDNPDLERQALERLWHSVDLYLQANNRINRAPQERLNNDTYGIIVEPTSFEARMGLARLYKYRESETTDPAEKKIYEDLAETQYREAFKQNLLAISQIGKSSSMIANEPGWSEFYNAASVGLQIQSAQSSTTPSLQSPDI
jgi:hypothetical protein